MPVYLDSFAFPDDELETSYIMGVRRTCYASFYPFKILGSSRKPGGFLKTKGKIEISVSGLMLKNAGQPFIAVPHKAKP